MEKEDLYGLEIKIDELKEKVESIHWELSKNSHVDELKIEIEFIRYELSDIKGELSGIYSKIDTFKLVELLYKVDELNQAQKETNKILQDIESSTGWIPTFAWVFFVICMVVSLKGCFGW